MYIAVLHRCFFFFLSSLLSLCLLCRVFFFYADRFSSLRALFFNNAEHFSSLRNNLFSVRHMFSMPRVFSTCSFFSVDHWRRKHAPSASTPTELWYVTVSQDICPSVEHWRICIKTQHTHIHTFRINPTTSLSPWRSTVVRSCAGVQFCVQQHVHVRLRPFR